MSLGFPSCEVGLKPVQTAQHRCEERVRVVRPARSGLGRGCPGRTLLFSRSVLQTMLWSEVLFFSSSLSLLISLSMFWICWKSFDKGQLPCRLAGPDFWAERAGSP